MGILRQAVFHMKVLCALKSSVCILYCVAFYNIKPEVCPVLCGTSLDRVHRSSAGIVTAVDITLGLYEGAELRIGAAVFNSKQYSYMQQYLLNVTLLSGRCRQQHCFILSVTIGAVLRD
jgi:hypothetical protein